ncbi:MAG: hypothetical protein OHK0047_38930 [Leptolyngbyaceae cyanobacterium]
MNLSGLRSQGELNVEVVDRDDTSKLEQWFEERWDDRFCLDISEQLAEIICPKNLEKMWQGYIDRYGLRGRVVPISQVIQESSNVPARFWLVAYSIDGLHPTRPRNYPPTGNGHGVGTPRTGDRRD